MQTREFLTTKEAARFFGYSHKTLEAWRGRGTGPVFIQMPNGHIRYERQELINWLNNRRDLAA